MTEAVINEKLPCNYTDYHYPIKRQQNHTELTPKHSRQAQTIARQSSPYHRPCEQQKT